MRARARLDVLVLAALAAACTQGVDSGPPALPEILATCADTSGDVQVRRGSQAFFEPAGIGAVLLAGNWLKTGKASSARVEFINGGRLEVEEDAVVIIDVLPHLEDAGTHDTAPLVAVASGQVRGVLSSAGGETRNLVIRNADGSKARLSSKAGEKSVEYRLTGNAQGTLVSVTGGEATLSAASGEQALSSGQSSQVTAKGPAPVEKLIGFPQSLEPGVDARLECGALKPVKLTWGPVEGARGYRVEIAEDLAFQKRLERHDGNDSAWLFAPKARGVYAWRVAAKDAKGRLGEYGYARRVFCEAEPPQDLLLGPTEAALVGYVKAPPRITFSWRSANAANYRLVVATDPGLTRKLVERTGTAQQVDVEGLAAGDYYWGAYAEDGKSARPVFLKARKLSIRKVSASRVKTVKSINEWGG
jgi:hypothetical protein